MAASLSSWARTGLRRATRTPQEVCAHAMGNHACSVQSPLRVVYTSTHAHIHTPVQAPFRGSPSPCSAAREPGACAHRPRLHTPPHCP